MEVSDFPRKQYQGYFEIFDNGSGEVVARVYKLKEVPDKDGRPQFLNDGIPLEFIGKPSAAEVFIKAEMDKLKRSE